MNLNMDIQYFPLWVVNKGLFIGVKRRRHLAETFDMENLIFNLRAYSSCPSQFARLF